MDGDARRQGGPRCRRDRGGRWPGEPGHRHHLGRQRARERQRAQRGRRARRPSDPDACGSASPTGGSGIGASRIIRSRSCATSAWCPPTCRCRRSRTTTQRAAVWDALRAAKLEERHQLVEVDGRPALDELAARRHRTPLDGTRRRRRPGVLPGGGRGGRPRGTGRRPGTGAGVPPATPRPSAIPVALVRDPLTDPLADADQVQVADPRPDQHQADVDDRQDHPEHAADRPPGAPSGARRRAGRSSRPA